MALSTPDVLIVGAGPTGLVLAFWLTRLGVAVRIIDKNPQPTTTSRALAVQARTLEFYRQIGLVEAVLSRPTFHEAAWTGKDRRAAPWSVTAARRWGRTAYRIPSAIRSASARENGPVITAHSPLGARTVGVIATRPSIRMAIGLLIWAAVACRSRSLPGGRNRRLTENAGPSCEIDASATSSLLTTISGCR